MRLMSPWVFRFVRWLCCAFLVAAAVPVRGAVEAGKPTPELHILCWTEYVPESVVKGFFKKMGAQVIVSNYNSNEQMLARLRERPGYYDIVQPSGFYVATLAKSAGLEALDRKRIPNFKNLDPAYLGLAHDPENTYSVPWMAGTVGIVYNAERVKQPPRDFTDVFSGRYVGRIVVVNDHREMVAWALASLGHSITDVRPETLKRVEPVLLKWLPQVKVFDSDSPKTALLNGDADVGIVWSGEAAALWLKDEKYHYVLPAQGAHMFLDSLAIPKGAPNKALAEDFINYILDPEVSVLISREYPYTNPNAAARKRLTRLELMNPASYPPGVTGLKPLRNEGNTPEGVDEFVRKVRERLPKAAGKEGKP